MTSQVLGVILFLPVFQSKLSGLLPLQVLQNDHKNLTSLPGNSYASIMIPLESTSAPLSENSVEAFAGSFSFLWAILAGIVTVGFLASLAMRHVPPKGQEEEETKPPTLGSNSASSSSETVGISTDQSKESQSSSSIASAV